MHVFLSISILETVGNNRNRFLQWEINVVCIYTDITLKNIWCSAKYSRLSAGSSYMQSREYFQLYIHTLNVLYVLCSRILQVLPVWWNIVVQWAILYEDSGRSPPAEPGCCTVAPNCSTKDVRPRLTANHSLSRLISSTVRQNWRVI